VAGCAVWAIAEALRRGRLASEARAGRAEADLSRSQAQSALAQATRLEQIFQSLEGPVVATDRAGIVVGWNAAAEQLVGVASARAMGRPVEEVFTQGEVLRVLAAAREGRAVREQVPVARADGPRVWEIAAAPVDGTGQAPGGAFPAVIEIRDVTEQARSLQVKTDFVANASHELRTPIASMRIALETLGNLGEEDRAMRDRLLGMLSGSVGRMEEMVRDLMDLSRLESPEAAVRIEPAPASEVAAGLTADFAVACRQRDLKLAFDLDPALERMVTDRKLLGLILGNLIDNATKFAFEGTEIRIVGRPLGVPGNGSVRGVRLEVIDRGVGIPLNQQARIFERYYQVDAARDGGRLRRGTGLGLAIVKHAVRRLGGTIRVQSVWQQGTTMTVELPGALPAT
jgi:PAS domain S-box-containing protein